MRRSCLMVSDLLAGIRPSVRVQRTRLLPQLLTRTRVPNIAARLARLPPERWPTSRRNGGPLQVGTMARFTVGMGGPLRVGIPGPLPSDFAAEIALHVASGAHAVVLMDQAGWHLTPKLDLPVNISLVAIPSKSPELNPQE